MATPALEVEIGAGLVAHLLEEQHPDLAGLPVTPAASGWDNVMFRLGDDLAVRLPRRAAAVPLLLHERRWLPVVAKGLPLPVPVPVRNGRPGLGYPWPWAIVPWLPGRPAEQALVEGGPFDSERSAAVLGSFLAAVHRPAPAEAPANPFRGIPLEQRDRGLREGVARLTGEVDTAEVLARWEAALDTPAWPGPPVWLHGDVHPLNVLVDDEGQVCAVVDFGDVTAGDPASDLSVGWMLFSGTARSIFRRRCRADADTWRRAHAWALALGVALASGDDVVRGIGLRTLEHALADDL